MRRVMSCTFAVTLALSTATLSRAASLDVPVREIGGDGQAANCATSSVAGLKASGDGFLAVRTGPGGQYRKIDELHNGDNVVVFEQRGGWAGVVYKTAKVTCSATRTRTLKYGKMGWVSMRWLQALAG